MASAIPKRLRILCAGDHFIHPELFVEALRVELGDGHQYLTDKVAWPHEPMHNEGEVLEWVGDESRLAELVRDAHVFVTHVAPVTERMLSTAGALRLIGCSRGGPVNVNVKAATDRGIPVVHAPGRNAAATAEFTVGLLLAGIRHIPEAVSGLRSGHWKGELYSYEQAGWELGGKTIGVLGAGQVGTRVTRILAGFGARVVVCDPYADPTVVREAGGVPVELDSLFRQSDVVTVHARLTPETRHIIDAAALAKMKRGAYLVNAARGGLVDYEALLAAIRSRHIFGAALDVFDVEPPPAKSALLRSPQITATPHIAGASRETAHRAAGEIAAEVGRFFRGEPLIACANPDIASVP